VSDGAQEVAVSEKRGRVRVGANVMRMGTRSWPMTGLAAHGMGSEDGSKLQEGPGGRRNGEAVQRPQARVKHPLGSCRVGDDEQTLRTQGTCGEMEDDSWWSTDGGGWFAGD
jgi:hypothetical protein